MKKINWKLLLIPPLLFILILTLSGCSKTPETADVVGNFDNCEFIDSYLLSNEGHYMCDEERLSIDEYRLLELLDNVYSTQDEVDEILEGYVIDGESNGKLSIYQNEPTGDWYICTKYIDENDIQTSDCEFLEIPLQYNEDIDEIVDYVKELSNRIQDNWQQMEDTQEWCEDIDCYALIEWLNSYKDIIKLEEQEYFIGEFVGVNAYGLNEYGINETYIVVEIADIEYEVIPLGNRTYEMGETIYFIEITSNYHEIEKLEGEN